MTDHLLKLLGEGGEISRQEEIQDASRNIKKKNKTKSEESKIDIADDPS